MTLLDELVTDASAEDKSVSTLLRKVKVLAARLKTVQLAEWVDHELVGYSNLAELPKYRGPFDAEVLGVFSDPFGRVLKNAPIPPVAFPKDYREGMLFRITFPQPIAEIESLSNSKDPLELAWPANALALANSMIQGGEVHIYEGMGIQHAWQRVSQSQLRAIIDNVRTRILELSLSIEEFAPDAGTKDAPLPDAGLVQQIVMNIFGGSPNIAVASSQFSQTNALPEPGDREELFSYLRSLGIEEIDVAELGLALEADERDGSLDSMGPQTTGWLGRSVARLTSIGTDVATGATGILIAQALNSYFSGPHIH
jgi:hypothetical protein